jgi:hypothetical protein
MQTYEELLAEGEAAIRQLIVDHQQENIGLDFKMKADSTHGRLTKEDKAVLAKALSAFSNSAGGLIIYGVNARANEEGIDCATAPAPISQIELFASEVTRATGELLMPRNDGIRVEAIASATANGSGYLIISVERSERRPHRSEASGDKRYYKRSGSNSYIMEHFDVEDMFKRQQQAKLAIGYSLRQGMVVRHGDEITDADIIISLELENVSPVTARFPYLHVLSSHPVLVAPREPVSPGFPLTGGPAKGAYWFDGGADHVINPGISRSACGLVLTIRPGRRIRDSDIQGIEIEYRAGCEHSPAFEGQLLIPRGEIMRAILGYVEDNHA